MSFSDHLREGARNLLVNCAEVQSGETLLIVHERAELGWYDNQIRDALADMARSMDIEPAIKTAGAPGQDNKGKVTDAVRQHDCTIFLARIGDQDRFSEPPPGCRAVMVYARDAQMLASQFGRTDHRAMLAMKAAVNDVLGTAENIEITCGLGTQITGSPASSTSSEPLDVGVRRFPMGVPAPVEATTFSGQVALAHFLTPTGSQPYEPASVRIEDPVFAQVENGKIAGFEGNPEDVARVNQHYDMVSEKFGIDRNHIHSWHAGIHPACAYVTDAAADPDRWSNTVFPNPRILHFHTCGNYAPGEICWMVLDATVEVDGVNLWENGRLCASRFERTSECLEEWKQLAPIFDNPEHRIGI
ncbi:MAG: hypothetical protein ACR2O0_01795 [Rhizobiaceae bacterium]